MELLITIYNILLSGITDNLITINSILLSMELLITIDSILLSGITDNHLQYLALWNYWNHLQYLALWNYW